MKLVEFIKEHENWEELLRAAPYNIIIKRKKFKNCDHALVKFCYDQRVSDFSIPLVRECRGVILEEGTWNVVARAMDKFGNYGEEWVDESSFDWDTASVQEKVDGTLIMLYYYNGWRIGTRNTIDAFDAELNLGSFNSFGDLALYTFKKVLRKTENTFSKFCGTLSSKATYWFELVSPYNRVIVNYNGYNLYFLGWRQTCYENGTESSVDYSICSQYFPMPKRYQLYSLEDCIVAARKTGADEEGFVVCDQNFNRMKIKSPKYLELAYLHNNGVWSNKRMVEVVLKGEEAEVLSYFPEWKEKFEKLKDRMNGLKFKADYYANLVASNYEANSFTTRAEYAKLVKKIVERELQPSCFWHFDNQNGNFDEWASKYLTVNKWIGLLRLED